MTTILKSTSKGQITLPSSWRKKFNTDRFIVTYDNDAIKIQPLEIENFIKKTSKKNELYLIQCATIKAKA